MTKKRVIRVIAFLLVISFVFYLLCDLFEGSNDLAQDKCFSLYRTLEDDTIDITMLGTSGIDRSIIPSQAYEEAGLSIGTLASDAMPSWLYTNVVEEAYIWQNPKLLIVDIRPFTQGNSGKSNPIEVRARRVIDSMELFSWNYIKTSFNAMKWISKADKTATRVNLSMILPFIKYHSKWSDDDFSFYNGFGYKPNEYGGYRIKKSYNITVKKQKVVKYNRNQTEALDPISEEALFEFLKYISENDIEVLFVDTPQFRGKLESGRANKVYDILEKEGMKVLHFYSEDSKTGFSIEGLNPETDFADSGHVNFYGAQKVTRALYEYIEKNYDLPDRRKDETAKRYWDGIHDNLLKLIADYEKENKEVKK